MRVVGRGYVDAVRNLEVTLRSLGGGSKEKVQEDWESTDLKKVSIQQFLTVEKRRHLSDTKSCDVQKSRDWVDYAECSTLYGL